MSHLMFGTTMENRPSSDRTVALTGFMACGKSTFGRAASEILGWQFVDLDGRIEESYGPIPAIFSRGGEPLFREIESGILESVLKESESRNCIVALGGGTVLSDRNMEILRGKGTFIIWLDTSFDIILSELGNANRPLVQEKSEEEIRALYDARRKRYASCADAVVKIESTNYAKAIKDIVATVRSI